MTCLYFYKYNSKLNSWGSWSLKIGAPILSTLILSAWRDTLTAWEPHPHCSSSPLPQHSCGQLLTVPIPVMSMDPEGWSASWSELALRLMWMVHRSTPLPGCLLFQIHPKVQNPAQTPLSFFSWKWRAPSHNFSAPSSRSCPQCLYTSN